MDLEELKNKQIEQMTEKSCLPKDDIEVILHLMEEVGEVCEAVREKKQERNSKMRLQTFSGN